MTRRVRVPESSLRQAADLAAAAAKELLDGDRASDATTWAIRASDALIDFADSGAVADLQRAGGAAVAALVVALARGHVPPPAELARVGAILAGEACEIIDAEIARLAVAIAAERDRAARRVLRHRRDNVLAERRAIIAAVNATIEKGE